MVEQRLNGPAWDISSRSRYPCIGRRFEGPTVSPDGTSAAAAHDNVIRFRAGKRHQRSMVNTMPLMKRSASKSTFSESKRS